MIEYYKKVVFENYANFKGRARRSEYWYYALMTIIISFILSILDDILGLKYGAKSDSGVVSSIYGLLVFIPGIAVSVRRLHNIGKSGWLILLLYGVAFVSCIFILTSVFALGFSKVVFGIGMIFAILLLLGSAIWLLVLFCTEGDSGENKYGPDPKIFNYDI